MEVILSSVIAALLPVAADAGKGLIRKWTGGTKAMQPTTVAEYIQVAQVDVEKLKAVAQLDTPAGPMPAWAVAFRGTYRYFAASFVIIFGCIFVAAFAYQYEEVRKAIVPDVLDLIRLAFFYTFGDRVYRNL